MDIQLINYTGSWPTSETQRKLRDLWGFDSGPFLDLVVEKLEEMVGKGSITLVVKEVTIGAKDYLVVNIGEYTITTDIARIISDIGILQILQLISSTWVQGETIDSVLVERLLGIKIYKDLRPAVQCAVDHYGVRVLMPILEAVKGGLAAQDAVAIVTTEIARGGDASKLITVRPRAELNRRF